MKTSPHRAVPVSADCTAAVELDMPGAHKRCRGNGAIYLPGASPGSAPVLPKIPCGCPCHGGAAK
jgi:hypothetical protein